MNSALKLRVATCVDAFRSSRSHVEQAALIVLAAFAATTFVSWGVVRTVEPKWNAWGYCSYVGYGKNVEHAALAMSAIASVCVAVMLPRGGRWRLLVLPVAAAAAALAWELLLPGRRYVLPLLLIVNVGYFAWWFAREPREPDEREPDGAWSRLVALGFMLMAATAVCLASLVPTRLDLFHNGEVVLGALDSLEGGRPYETMFVPHGMNESWLPSLFMRWTGNRGQGALTISRSFQMILGTLATYVLSWNLLRRRVDAALMTLAISALYPEGVLFLSYATFGLVALHLLTHRPSLKTACAAGALLGWGFLWRIDVGTFAIVAAAGFLLLDEYYARGYGVGASLASVARDWRRHKTVAFKLGATFAGMAAVFLFTRATIGLPTFAMFRVALVELPRYHADNTGYPLPLPLRALEGLSLANTNTLRWITTQFLFFSLCLASFLAVKAFQRRLDFRSPASRFLAAALLLGLLYAKSGMDRSDLGHLRFALFPLTLIVILDLLAQSVSQVRRPALRSALLAGLAVPAIGVGLLDAISFKAGLDPLHDRLVQLRREWASPRDAWVALQACCSPASRPEDLLQPARCLSLPFVEQGVRQLRETFDRHEIGERQFLAVHSAPQLYPLTDRRCPTQFYMLGWAMNDAMQAIAVQELHSANLRAILECNGMGGAIAQYDVPDSHRVPAIHAVVERAKQDCVVYATQLGALHVRPEPVHENCELTVAPDGVAWMSYRGRRLVLASEGELGNLDHVRQSSAGVHLQGWAFDRLHRRKAEAILVFAEGRCVAELAVCAARPDLVELHGPRAMLCGVDVVLPSAWFESEDAAQLRFLAVQGERAAFLADAHVVVDREPADGSRQR